MKITIVSMEIPYPPIHGGRVDIWRRIVALSKLGADIQLVCWSYSPPPVEDTAEIQRHVKSFYPITYKSGLSTYLQRGVDLLKYPLQVTSRILRGEQWRSLLKEVERFSPEVIVADHVHCGLTARSLSENLGCPFVLRSHDIEHLHYGYWLKSAQGLNKLKLRLTLLHLKSYEYSTFKECSAFYDISVDDLNFWKQQGFTHGRFLPPLADLESLDDNSDLENPGQLTPVYDVVFLGNLRTENNVAGVLWFLDEVLPDLVSQLPNIRILIAGSNPVQAIVEACEKRNNVDLKPNPVSAKTTYQSGKVLINPVSTGSGTSIKSVDMLTLNRPIVTLEKGLFGLPASARQYYKLASDAKSFGNLIRDGLRNTTDDLPSKAEIQELFGYPVIERFLQDLQTVVAQH